MEERLERMMEPPGPWEEEASIWLETSNPELEVRIIWPPWDEPEAIRE